MEIMQRLLVTLLIYSFFLRCYSNFSTQRHTKNAQKKHLNYLGTVKLAKDNLIDLNGIYKNLSDHLRIAASETSKEIEEENSKYHDFSTWLGSYDLERITVDFYEALHEAAEDLMAKYRKEKKSVQIMELYVRHLRIEDEYLNDYEEKELKYYDGKIQRIKTVKKLYANMIKGLEKLQGIVTSIIAQSVAENVIPDTPEYDKIRNHVTEIGDYLIRLQKNDAVRIIYLTVLKELAKFLQK